MLDVEFAQLSDTGLVREHNEDYLGSVIPATPAEARSHGWLFALADGVGGQERGEVASLTAIESMMSGFRGAPRGEPLPALLTRLVQAANAHVLDAGLTAAPGGVNMATTMVVAMLTPPGAAVSPASSTCALAAWTRRVSKAGSGSPRGAPRKPDIMLSMAVREATSPRSCPPTPSASANNQPCERASAGVAGITEPR